MRDCGRGIPAELGDTLFTRAVTGSHSKGTGIGLALARALAEAEGGQLRVAESDRAELVARFPHAARQRRPSTQ